ncbi:hypothetical protein DPMN_034819 [Dreissena polymorpha]|uniref:Uncharacterized protein n=1 Tax=Dreissena polymorpha TaxID=45954 RepID=A0A9D4M661_DREPO|nr:hypothetical protein DPMN_034819 [Dreissena polymorpha]
MYPCNGRYLRFEARRLNRRLTDESCTIGECNLNVFRGRPQHTNSPTINTHSFRCKKAHVAALLHGTKAYYGQMWTLSSPFPGKNQYLVSVEEIMRLLPEQGANPRTPDR